MAEPDIAEKRVEITPGVPDGYAIGLDLGQAQDFTAVCVVQVSECERQMWTRTRFEREATLKRSIRTRRFSVVNVHRYPLGTSYSAIGQSVRGLVEQLKAGDRLPAIYADASGCGRPVVEAMREGGLKLTGVIITPGERVTKAGQYSNVPKKILASALDIAFDEDRLRITEDSPYSEILRTELQNFRVKKTAAGNDKLEAHRTGQHDDLVLACALAVWGAGARRFPLRPELRTQILKTNLFAGI